MGWSGGCGANRRSSGSCRSWFIYLKLDACESDQSRNEVQACDGFFVGQTGRQPDRPRSNHEQRREQQARLTEYADQSVVRKPNKSVHINRKAPTNADVGHKHRVPVDCISQPGRSRNNQGYNFHSTWDHKE